MKNPELFHKTVGILVKAYLNESLVHNSCQACAIGNIIYNIDRKFHDSLNYDEHLAYVVSGETQITIKNKLSPIHLKQLSMTGYTINDIIKIERSFEAVRECKDESGYKGLMNVVNTLSKIHKTTEVETSQAKDLFVVTN